MKIPRSIQLGGHRISIIKLKSSDLKSAGSYDDWYQTIKINIDDSCEDAQAEVFLHEIIHGIDTKYELGLEHKQVAQLSQMLFAVIRNNKLDFVMP